MRNRTRVIAVAAATAALAAGSTVTAMASTTGVKPGAHATPVSTGKRCVPVTEMADRLGVSPARLDQALLAVKISLRTAGGTPTNDQFEAALARYLAIPQARVRETFAAEELCNAGPIRAKPAPSGSTGQQGDEALAAAVARELHESTARVSAALQPLFAAGRADPSSPAFATAASSLGVSTQQLTTALTEAKQSLAGATQSPDGATQSPSTDS
jgi:hypothetical protein